MKVSLKEITPSTTEYQVEIEYLAFRGFVVKLISKIVPSLFKKQVVKWVNRFKIYVEENY